MRGDLCTTPLFVTPAKAGIQKVLKSLDTGFRRGDDLPRFRRHSKVSRGDLCPPSMKWTDGSIPHELVIAYTMSSTKRLNDSFSTNCLYTCVSSFRRSCITLPSAWSCAIRAVWGGYFLSHSGRRRRRQPSARCRHGCAWSRGRRRPFSHVAPTQPHQERQKRPSSRDCHSRSGPSPFPAV